MRLENIFIADKEGVKLNPVAYQYESINKFIKYHQKINTGDLFKELSFLYYFLNKDVFPARHKDERTRLIKLKIGLDKSWSISTQLQTLINELSDDFETPVEKSLTSVYSALIVCTDVTNETLKRMNETLKIVNELSVDTKEEKEEKIGYIKNLQNELTGIMKIASDLPKLIETTKKLEDSYKKTVVNDVNLGNKKITVFED